MSEPAIAAIESLDSSWFVNWVVRGSIHDPAMGGDEHHPNNQFFKDVEWYLTCRQIAHAGDALNTYCQSILAEVLEADADTWPLVQRKIGKKESREEAISILKLQGKLDGAVREAIRESLGIVSTPEGEIVAVLRNKIVHQGGVDPEMKVAEVLRKFPPRSFSIYPNDIPDEEIPFGHDSGGRLVIDGRTGYWASRHVGHHIHMLDQMICHRYGVPRRRSRSKKSTFTLSATTKRLPYPPGTPLPVSDSKIVEDLVPPKLAELPPYTVMADPKEAECAAIWLAVRDQLDEFVRRYCKESGVTIRTLGSSRAGHMRSNTLVGHDLSLSYGLTLVGEPDAKGKDVGIRLRQEEFTPFITIWSSHSQMRDFRPCEISEDVKEYLRDCIDDAVSR